MVRRINTVFWAAAVALTTSCTWVKPIEGADDVALISAERAKSCERIGAAIVMTADEVGIIDRGDRKVATELLTLAKNQAVKTGGNAVVEGEVIREGEQRFLIYRCS